ncbi:ATP-binding protein [Companilactobacillus allii]|uniref:ATPase AAA-type core domain-containing protein n=1 Tax=Companilactobacillus allii TaxID=1847728 RepID=A0A1P8Q2B0_9LACO|nr:AAA family ATPase [Companilactobacillus allii]APX71971.1 hypothetical protein BTM29_05100 [Companilactobacillus allii]USQ69065.1 ATP-binding protein [Companilactobacillus allii]
MFTSVEFENYMSLKKLKLNIKQKNDFKKIVAIYGENGSGKSNIVSAFMNLRLSLDTLNAKKKLDEFLSSDTKNENIMNVKHYTAMYSDRSRIDRVFENTYLLGATEPMSLKYNFKIYGHFGYYKLIFKKDSSGSLYLASEELNYLIKKSSGVIFHITSDENQNISIKVSPQLFKNANLSNSMDDLIKRLWGKHTFLAIFQEFAVENNEKYIIENVLNNFLKVQSKFEHLSFKTDNARGANNFRQMLHNLISGTVNNGNTRNKIENTSESLNKYFVPLYSDIMSLHYKTESLEDNKTKYELYEKKRISDEIVEIPFVLESNGTKKLLNLFPLLLNAVNGDTVIIDEIDQGIHDLLIDRIIENVKDDITGQLIFTTHDTQVMKQLDVSSLYVIQVDSSGNKRVSNISKASKSNIASNNNIQKLYLEGYFAGIPYADDVDFYDIIENLGVNHD